MARTSRRIAGLSAQLTRTTVIATAIPMALGAVLMVYTLDNEVTRIDDAVRANRAAIVEDVIGNELQGKASAAVIQIDRFLIERTLEAQAWARNGIITNAARAGHEIHKNAGLVGMTMDAIEERFRIDKTLGRAPAADAYLRQQIAASPYFAEVFFTDRNGFNVALTNATSDFVQSDEPWWQHAWSQSLAVGKASYDDSAGVWSIDISVRIDDDTTPVGVLKVVLAIERMQTIADETAHTTHGTEVQIVTADGLLIAETGSGHARDRIMNEKVNIHDGNEGMRDAFGATRIGITSAGNHLTAHARTGGREIYSRLGTRYEGLDWVVIIQRPIEHIETSLGSFRRVSATLQRWMETMLWALAGLVAITIAINMIAISASARRTSQALGAVREQIDDARRGIIIPAEQIRGPSEVVDVAEATEALAEAFTRALRTTRL